MIQEGQLQTDMYEVLPSLFSIRLSKDVWLGQNTFSKFTMALDLDIQGNALKIFGLSLFTGMF